jgi:hypothetical protein
MADELVHRVTDPTAAAATAAAKAAATSTAYPPRQRPTDTTAAPQAADEHPAGGSATSHNGAENPVSGNAANHNAANHNAASHNVAGDGATDPTDPAAVPPGVTIDIQLVMTDRALFDGDNEPAILIGHGPIPAPIARQLVRTAGPHLKAWIRRLYTDPTTGHLINGDAKRRDFPHAARQFLIARDHTCRTPWCDAPIRHSDHVTGHPRAGPPGSATPEAPAKPATTPRKHQAGPPPPNPTASPSP